MDDISVLKRVDGSFCPNCKKPVAVLVRMTKKWTKTKNETGACRNINCSLFLSVRKIRNWKIKTDVQNSKRDREKESRLNRPARMPAFSCTK